MYYMDGPLTIKQAVNRRQQGEIEFVRKGISDSSLHMSMAKAMKDHKQDKHHLILSY